MSLLPLFLTTPNTWLLLKRLFDASSECLVFPLQIVSMLVPLLLCLVQDNPVFIDRLREQFLLA